MNKEQQERIEKLKDPKQAQPYWMRTKDEQGVLFSAGIKNTFQVTKSLPNGFHHGWPLSDWCDQLIILKPNYDPGPEGKVFECGGILGIDKPTFKPLYILPGLPGFIEFWYEEGPITTGHLSLHHVASAIRNGHKVYARFVKELQE